MRRAACAWVLAGLFLFPCIKAQVIEFENRGLKYQTLTRHGVTIMFAPLATRVREYAIFQVAVSNGSAAPYIIRPENFYFVHAGESIEAASAERVIGMLMQKGSGGDVVKLVNTYETALYGASLKSTNGFEARRQNMLAFGASKLRAAATASAVALVQTKLAPGESTDGAVFLPLDAKALAMGHLQVRTNTDTFDFNEE
ncbi:MAG TPA: hypothetical protein VKV17_04685 [Bryobacteraceae bacterium]|nr:hypothetical protein [Bryobacteraceae bacterium]